jgi:hypothetical protein
VNTVAITVFDGLTFPPEDAENSLERSRCSLEGMSVEMARRGKRTRTPPRCSLFLPSFALITALAAAEVKIMKDIDPAGLMQFRDASKDAEAENKGIR